MDDWGDTLRTSRLRRGLSQRELAERSGVHQPTIAAIERGRRQASPASRRALEDALRRRPSEALAEHRDEVRAVLARHHGADAYVFGSAARGDDQPGSDLDLMLDLPDGTGLLALARLVRELETVVGVPVDVVDARAGGPVLDEARREAVPL